MKKFYFVGGPKPGQAEEFFRRLNQIGGTPSGWRLYPHADHSGKALHLVDAKSQDGIVHHLEHFHDIYEHSEIVEIIERRPQAAICSDGEPSHGVRSGRRSAVRWSKRLTLHEHPHLTNECLSVLVISAATADFLLYTTWTHYRS